jgi:2-polyprenyl-3-methyl-5-hydroxy-6-metoxy-1,4-benzoquinol methylase
MPDVEHLDHCILCTSEQINYLDRAYGFMKCSACGLVFDNPRPTQATIAEHYSKPEQYDDWVAILRARKRLWLRRIHKVRRNAVSGSLLDVGAGIGEFLSVARPYFTEVTGTEISSSAISYASTNYGLFLHRGTIESLQLPVVDNLTMFHVLEHVASPKTTLARCHDLINPGGRLFVCVPNDIRAWPSRIRALKNRIQPNGKSPVTGLPRWEMTKEIHLSHFTSSSLAHGVRAAGFRVLSIRNDPYYAAAGWKLALHSANYLVHETLRLPTYQCMWLVAEKPQHSH